MLVGVLIVSSVRSLLINLTKLFHFFASASSSHAIVLFMSQVRFAHVTGAIFTDAIHVTDVALFEDRGRFEAVCKSHAKLLLGMRARTTRACPHACSPQAPNGSCSRTFVLRPYSRPVWPVQVMGMYFVSLVIMMRMNMPERYRAKLVDVLGDLEFSYYHHWFDRIFLVRDADLVHASEGVPLSLHDAEYTKSESVVQLLRRWQHVSLHGSSAFMHMHLCVDASVVRIRTLPTNDMVVHLQQG